MVSEFVDEHWNFEKHGPEMRSVTVLRMRAVLRTTGREQSTSEPPSPSDSSPAARRGARDFPAGTAPQLAWQESALVRLYPNAATAALQLCDSASPWAVVCGTQMSDDDMAAISWAAA